MGLRQSPFPHSATAPHPPKSIDEFNAANEAREAALCEPCRGIQRNWRKAPGHAELVPSQTWKDEREDRKTPSQSLMPPGR